METQRYQPRPDPGSADTILEDVPPPLEAACTEDGMAPTALGATAEAVELDPRCGMTTLARTTVLPRLERVGDAGPKLVIEEKPRYTAQKQLGEGASGEVELVLDNDIQRLVALKRLKAAPERTDALMRFVDEIRMIGSLEHPNIVPIHDVGVDEGGRYYFVMKAVQGETLEDVIVKLAKGDPEYHRKYTFEYRVQVFIEICKAVEFAHARGVIHRDLKPANVMVGEHGEVMVMDWGIAKHTVAGAGAPRRTEPESALQIPDFDEPASPPEGGTPSFDRMYRTEYQSIVGTPLYMSPEQALGRVEELDERSDVYSLCALLYEFLTLSPYLKDKKTMKELLVAVVTEEPSWAVYVPNPHQPRVPAQYSHFVAKGLKKGPDERYQSVAEMRRSIQRINEGYFEVKCPITAVKRPLHGALHFIDKHPQITMWGMIAVALSLLGLAAYGVVGALT